MGDGRSISEYDEETTRRCESVLLTLLRSAGPWKNRLYLAGGLAPRYLLPDLPADVPRHIGTTDVDVVLPIAVVGGDRAAYRALATNLREAGFRGAPGEDGKPSSFRWRVAVDGFPIDVEFVADDPTVEPGRVFKPKVIGLPGAGKMGAFCVRGADLAARDYREVRLVGTTLDGAKSFTELRVANLTPFIALKANAYHDRRKRKDVYDLVYVLANHPGGPDGAAKAVSASEIGKDPFVERALELLADHFADIDLDGPRDYADFMNGYRDSESDARNRLVALTAVGEFLSALSEVGAESIRRGNRGEVV
jgi:hypothetical protein